MLLYMKLLFVYLLTLPVLTGIDLVWLGIVMKGFYQTRIGHLFGTGFNMPAAVAFYLIYTLGVLYFASYPAFAEHSLLRAIMTGAALGLLAYATYDLSNMATLAGWPLSVTIIDILWGGLLTAITASAGYFFFVWLF